MIQAAVQLQQPFIRVLGVSAVQARSDTVAQELAVNKTPEMRGRLLCQ